MNKINSDILATLIWCEKQMAEGYANAQAIRNDLKKQGYPDEEINAQKKVVEEKLNTLIARLKGGDKTNE